MTEHFDRVPAFTGPIRQYGNDRSVVEFRVSKMMFVEIFGARGLSHRRQFFPGQIDIGGDNASGNWRVDLNRNRS